MALVVEDGTGKVDAESYDSVAGISATLAKTGEDAAWLALASETIREQVARKATRVLDSEYRFRGVKGTAGQALEWPRLDARDDDGYAYESNAVPTRLKQALAQLCAAGSVTGADLQPDQTTPGTVESESISIAGVISESITYQGGKSQSVFYRKAEGLLSELIETAGILERA